ncbi:MAG: protein translocase subunit SecF [bacterium]|nr:protein translocase subunit SecF [bacterium]
MRIFKEDPNFQFMNRRFVAFAISGVIIAVGALLYFSRGFNLGIDFTGGTNIEVSLKVDTSENDIRSALGSVGLSKSVVQRTGTDENKFFIKTIKSSGMEGSGDEATETETTDDPEETSKGISDLVRQALMGDGEKSAQVGKEDLNNISHAQMVKLMVDKGVSLETAEAAATQVVNLRDTGDDTIGLIENFSDLEQAEVDSQAVAALKEKTYLGDFTFLSVEMVGPQVGRDLREKATLATVWAMIGMLIYIGFRFRFIFGIAAVITLLHDVLVCLTFILLFNIEVSLSVVAGILTLVGYSLNDTIVIFDRVRDNLKAMKRQDSGKILDRSINQTLSRTIVTSGTTLATVMALFFFGGEVIHSFSFTLMVGVIIGTYSSIFQSCAWLKIWDQKVIGGKKKQ